MAKPDLHRSAPTRNVFEIDPADVVAIAAGLSALARLLAAAGLATSEPSCVVTTDAAALARIGLTRRPVEDACRAGAIEGARKGSRGWVVPAAALETWASTRTAQRRAKRRPARVRTEGVTAANDAAPSADTGAMIANAIARRGGAR